MDYSSLPSYDMTYQEQNMGGGCAMNSPISPSANEMFVQPDMIQPPATQDPNQQLQAVHADYENKLNLIKNAIKKKNRKSGDLMSMIFSRKKEFTKLLLLAFTILLAISMHTVFYDLLKTYINMNDFSQRNEILIKLAYPLVIMIIMWLIRSLSK